MNPGRGTLLGALGLLAAVLVGAMWWLGDARDGTRAGLERAASAAPGPAMDLEPSAPRGSDVPIEPPSIDAVPSTDASPTTDDASAAIVIRARLVAPDDSPVVGATITFHAARDGAWRESEPLARETSDAEGRFQIALDALPAKGSGIVVRAEGFFDQSSGGPGENDWGGDEFTWKLNWVALAHGVARDALNGAPVAHALVDAGGPAVETDAQGRFELLRVLVGYEAIITARHPDFAPTMRTLMLARPEPVELDLELRRGVRVDVEIVERETGAPIAGASVRRTTSSEPFAHADGAGRWSFRLVPGEAQSVTATHDGFVPVSWKWDGADATSAVSVRIPLQRCAWIDGFVRDEAGVPLAGVSAYAERRERGWMVNPFMSLPPEVLAEFGLPGRADDLEPRQGSVAGDADGAFHLQVIPGLEYVAHVSRDAYVAAASEPLALATPGQRAQVDFVLVRAGSLVGRLLVNGEPSDEVELLARDVAGKFLGRGRVASVGTYRLDGLPAGEVVLEVRHRLTRAVWDEQEVVVEAGVALVHDILAVRVASAIVGRVTWADGTPAASVYVNSFSAAPAARFVGSVATDDDGRYALAVDPDGLFDLTASKGVASEERRAASGDEDVDFVLPVLGALSLRLVDAGTHEPIGAPAGAGIDRWLWWRLPSDETARPLSARGTDQHDVIEVELPVGEVELTVALTVLGYAPRTLRGVIVPPASSAQPLEVALQGGSEVALRLVDAETGEPGMIPDHVAYLVREDQRHLVRQVGPGEANQSFGGGKGIQLRIDDAELRGRWLMRSEDGLRRQRGLSPGRWVLLVFPPDVRLEPDVIDVPLAGDGPLDVRFWMSTAPDDG